MPKPSITHEAALALLDRAIKSSVVTKSGGQYLLKDRALGSSKDKAATFISEHPDVVAALDIQPDQPAAPVDQPVASAVTKEPPATEREPNVAETATQQDLPSESGADAKSASNLFVVVTSKSEQGRRRAGRFFTRERTRIALADLADDDVDALQSDPDLVVEIA